MESNALKLIQNESVAGSFTTPPISILNSERFALEAKCDFAGSFQLQVSVEGNDSDWVPHPKGGSSFAANEYIFIKGKSFFKQVRLVFTGTGTLQFLNLFTKANDG